MFHFFVLMSSFYSKETSFISCGPTLTLVLMEGGIGGLKQPALKINICIAKTRHFQQVYMGMV